MEEDVERVSDTNTPTHTLTRAHTRIPWNCIRVFLLLNFVIDNKYFKRNYCIFV